MCACRPGAGGSYVAVHRHAEGCRRMFDTNGALFLLTHVMAAFDLSCPLCECQGGRTRTIRDPLKL